MQTRSSLSLSFWTSIAATEEGSLLLLSACLCLQHNPTRRCSCGRSRSPAADSPQTSHTCSLLHAACSTLSRLSEGLFFEHPL